MNNINQQNAISRRLDKLTRYWADFTSNEESKICLWSVKHDETEMIDAFYAMESSEHGKTPDLFLQFQTPWTGDYFNYTKELVNELKALIEASKEEIEDAEVDLGKWEPSIGKSSNTDSDVFVKNVIELSNRLELDGQVVIYLSPTKIVETKGLDLWLTSSLPHLTKDVSLMVMDHMAKPQFNELREKGGKQVQVFKPDLKMDDAISELAAQGKPNDPSTKFRKLYVAIMQASSKPDLGLVKELAKKAFILTRKHNWKLMESTIHMVVGGAYASSKKLKPGLDHYENAIQLIKDAIEGGDPLAEQQIVVAYLSKAMVEFIQKRYAAAALTYELAGHAADHVKNDYLSMDSWRMAGTCYKKDNVTDKAMECLRKSLTAGAKLDEDTRKQSSLPFAGKEFYDISSYADKETIDKEMIELCGEDWEELTNIKNLKKQEA